MDQLQESFDKALETRFAKLTSALRDRQAGDCQGATGRHRHRGAQGRGDRGPGQLHGAIVAGGALAGAKDSAAFEPLERAAALVPMATGERSPNAIMAALAEDLGDLPRAIRAYRALLEHDHAAVDAARRLAAIAEKVKDEETARLAYDRVVALDPFDAAGAHWRRAPGAQTSRRCRRRRVSSRPRC